MTHSYKRGFTLIELLVVIAIIGILAGIVLAALGNTRQKGADAGVQGNLDSIRTQAEVYAGNNSNSYGSALSTTTSVASCTAAGTLFSDPTIKQAITAAQAATGGTVTCAANSGYWAISVQLKTDTTKDWCVSSGGQSKQITAGGTALQAANSCL